MGNPMAVQSSTLSYSIELTADEVCSVADNIEIYRLVASKLRAVEFRFVAFKIESVVSLGDPHLDLYHRSLEDPTIRYIYEPSGYICYFEYWV